MTASNQALFRPKRFNSWFLVIVLAIVFGLLWLLYHEASILFSSLMIAWGCFYFLSPIVDFLESLSIRRGAACVLVLIGVSVIAYASWLWVMNHKEDILGKVDIERFQNTLKNRVQEAVIWVGNELPGLKKYMGPAAKTAISAEETVVIKIPKKKDAKILTIEPAAHGTESTKALPDQIDEFTQKQIKENAPGLAMKVFGFIPSLILVPYFTFFFLKDGRSFKKTLIQWIPNRYFEPALKFFYEMDRRMRSYLLCTLLDCMLVGLLVGIGSAFVGAPYPALFGLLAFLLNSIPLIGPLIYGAICLIVTIGEGSPTDVIVGYLAVFLLSRICDDFIFTPSIYGKSHHLHPVAVVCAVLIGERIAGAWGMFLAIPVVSILGLAVTIIREISIGEDNNPAPRISHPFA
jgi:predicted PurR-regulated permease PerM